MGHGYKKKVRKPWKRDRPRVAADEEEEGQEEAAEKAAEAEEGEEEEEEEPGKGDREGQAARNGRAGADGRSSGRPCPTWTRSWCKMSLLVARY